MRSPVFLPKNCKVDCELSDGSANWSATVRKAQLEGPEPTYTLTLQLDDDAPSALLDWIPEEGGLASPPAPAPAALGALPGWAVRMISHGKLDEATWYQVQSARPGVDLLEALEASGKVDSADLAIYLALDQSVPYLDPREFTIPIDNRELLPEELTRRHCVFPLFQLDGVVTLGMTDPGNLALVDQVRLRTNCQVEPCLCSADALIAVIERTYRGISIDTTHKRIDERPVGGDGNSESVTDSPEAGAVVTLVHGLVEESVRAGAADIHIEPERDFLRIRLRVDGVLHEHSRHPIEQHPAIVSRIKVMAQMDIAETRKPQDGHFDLAVDGSTVDVRVSTIPTVHGENTVLRLLLSEEQALSLDDLAIPVDGYDALVRTLDQPNGLALVVGPTGSGKTTTLYASLARLSTIERNVVTVEDPVEIRLPLLRQTQVNPKAGVTFASGLRSILRQDPDVIMVGEIRDMETGEIAVQAALTGHLVLSTLHTNSAAGALVRLVEMGVAPFLLTSCLRVIVSQRLVRRVCKACSGLDTPSERLLTSLDLNEGDGPFSIGAGCGRCMGTGYKGRIGVYEVLELTPELCDTLLSDASRDEIERESERSLRCTLLTDGLAKARAGVTSLAEIARLVGYRPAPSRV